MYPCISKYNDDTVNRVRLRQREQSNGKEIRTGSLSQRSRGKYLNKPPMMLAYLIDIVNCLPPDASQSGLKNPKVLREDVRSIDENEAEGDYSSHLDSAACMATQHLPIALRDYVWRGEWKGSSFKVNPYTIHPDIVTAITGKKSKHPVQIFMPLLPGAFRRYAKVWDAHEKLRGIARYSIDPMERWKLWRLGKYATVTTSIFIDEQGMVRERKSLFSEVIEGQDIESARIRECPICKRIFWAGRKDAQQCGAAKCKSALSSRLNRNPELRKLYNKARRTKRRKYKEAQKLERLNKKGK